MEINPLATNNPQIENLYNLIDFLESVQNKFVEKAPLFNDLCELSKERDGLSPRNRFADKAKFDAIQINILEKLHEINPLYNEIKNKLEELDIWQREDVTGAGIYNKYVSIASALKENATAEKAQKAMFYLKKYTDFRKITKSMFFDLGFVFSNLDEVLKIIYDFFNDADTNEFDALLITKSS